MTKEKFLIQISRTLKNDLQQNIFSPLARTAYTSISQSFMSPLVSSFHTAAPLALTILVLFSHALFLLIFQISASVFISHILTANIC